MADLKQHVENIDDSYVYGRIDDASHTHTIQHGSSFGTPWSLMHFWPRSLDRTVDADYWGFQNTNEDNLTVKPYMFWRIDKIKEGPVLSLRYYTWWERAPVIMVKAIPAHIKLVCITILKSIYYH